jgi:transcription elongation factor Elf1
VPLISLEDDPNSSQSPIIHRTYSRAHMAPHCAILREEIAMEEEYKCPKCNLIPDDCTCEVENPDHSGECLCEKCEHKIDCSERRGEDEPHIFESQFLHCHETLGRQDFKPDEDWIFDMLEDESA